MCLVQVYPRKQVMFLSSYEGSFPIVVALNHSNQVGILVVVVVDGSVFKIAISIGVGLGLSALGRK